MDDGTPDAAGTEHYFTESPRTRSLRRHLRFLYRGELLSFMIDRSVFASHRIDPGTALLIESVEVRAADRVLDLGCGWGAIGIAAAKVASRGWVVLTDVNRRAVGLARENLRLNSVKNAEVRSGSLYNPVRGDLFDLILSNPPYHAGRAPVLALLEGGVAHLKPEGRIVIVGKGSQGIKFYQTWLEERWPGRVEVLGRRSGYRVLGVRPI